MSSQLREIRLQLGQRHGLDVSQPTISHHLKVLRTAGLLDSERRGSWVYYRVVADALRKLSLLLDTDTDTDTELASGT